MTHRPFRKRRDGQAGVHSQVGPDHAAIADIHVPIVKTLFCESITPSELLFPMIDPPRIWAVVGTLKKISVRAVNGLP